MKNILISACLFGVPCRYDGKSKPRLGEELLLRLKKKYNLIPVCPEIYGGLPTPRTVSERVGDRVLMKDGVDVTEKFCRGAEITLQLARSFDCRTALLKAKSPSCGHGLIHDGGFTGALTKGDGVTAELLIKNGIAVIDEEKIGEIL